jgi:hypothetical protein
VAISDPRVDTRRFVLDQYAEAAPKDDEQAQTTEAKEEEPNEEQKVNSAYAVVREC